MMQRLAMWLSMVLGLVGGRTTPAPPSPTPVTEKMVETDGGLFAYRYFEIGGQDQISLIYNYDHRIQSEQLIASHGCEKAINGGFYDENWRPLGLVISDSSQLAPNRPNALFDGYVYTRPSGEMGISLRPVFSNVKNEVQTGPILVSSGRERAMTSTLRPARRMVAAQLTGGRMIFVSVFRSESQLDGPALSDLAKVILKIGQLQKWDIDRAINLDGGSASAFYDGDDLIEEWQPVGSLWCIKSKL